VEHFDTCTVLSALCKATSRWGMYVSFQHQQHANSHYELSFGDLEKAMPYFDWQKHGQIFVDGCGYFLFDNEEECEEAFWSTVGDDGPTETNSYNGPVRVYALTCSPDGQLCNENT